MISPYMLIFCLAPDYKAEARNNLLEEELLGKDFFLQQT
jgi:hypothetical protein